MGSSRLLPSEHGDDFGEKARRLDHLHPPLANGAQERHRILDVLLVEAATEEPLEGHSEGPASRWQVPP